MISNNCKFETMFEVEKMDNCEKIDIEALIEALIKALIKEVEKSPNKQKYVISY